MLREKSVVKDGIIDVALVDRLETVMWTGVWTLSAGIRDRGVDIVCTVKVSFVGGL